MNYLIDPKNYNSPEEIVGYDYYTPLSLGIVKQARRYIQSHRFVTDDGFLMSSSEETIFPLIKNEVETLSYDYNNEGKLLSFTIRMDHSEKITWRTYKKIQDVLAHIGGFIKIIYLIMFAITRLFVSKLYFEEITNSVYNFEHENFVEISKTLKSLETIRYNSNTRPNIFSDGELNEKPPIESRRRCAKVFFDSQNFPRLKISFWEYMKAVFSRFFRRSKIKNKTFEKLQTGKQDIKQKLDVSYIIRKLYEIDKLKMLLLNENQNRLFDNLTKPVILNNSTINIGFSKNSKVLHNQIDDIEKFKKIQEAYQNIKKQMQLSPIDQKIVNLMDDDVKNLLEGNHFLNFFLKNILDFNLERIEIK